MLAHWAATRSLQQVCLNDSHEARTSAECGSFYRSRHMRPILRSSYACTYVDEAANGSSELGRRILHAWRWVMALLPLYLERLQLCHEAKHIDG